MAAAAHERTLATLSCMLLARQRSQGLQPQAWISPVWTMG